MALHHPSAEILADYARGGLRAGAALVVSCHVGGCEACRHEVAVWESIGGEMLRGSDPVTLSGNALECALRRIDDEPVGEIPHVDGRLPGFLDRFDIPEQLRSRDIGFRRWLAPGIWFAPVRGEADRDARLYLVYAKQGAKLPRHTHRGREFTMILHGSYSDELGRFEVGDFVEADDDVIHAPAVTTFSDCLCVISTDAPMWLSGWPARIIQSLAGNRY